MRYCWNRSKLVKRGGILSLIGLIFFISVNAFAEPKTELLVSAGVGLKDVLTRLAVEFEKTHAACKIALNFAAAGQLRSQIENGAPVDVLMVPSVADMDMLAAKDLLLTDTRINLISTQLVLIKNKTQDIALHTIEDLTSPAVKRIAMGNPDSMPGGRYAKEALTFYHLYDQIQSKVVFGENIRQVLDYVARGEVEAGFVFLTDALTSTQAEVALTLPDNTHSPIIFPAAVIKSSQHQELAKQFIQYLHSTEGMEIFEKYGFITLK